MRDLKSKKLNIILLILVVGMSVALLLQAFYTDYLKMEFPWGRFFVHSDNRFEDFYVPRQESVEFGFSANLFPSIDVLFYFFAAFSKQTALLIFMVVGYGYLCIMNLKHTWIFSRSVIENILCALAITFLSQPVLFAIDRGNMEIFVFIFISSFCLLFQMRLFYLASIVLTLAIGMKLFPAVFLVLYLKHKRYKELAFVAILLVAMFAILPLGLGDAELSISRFRTSMGFYQAHLVMGDVGYQFGHSAYYFLKAVSFIMDTLLNLPMRTIFHTASKIFVPTYNIITLCVYFVFGKFIYTNKSMPYWIEVLILVCLICLLPNVSADYRLIHLFTPLYLFLNSTSETKYDKHFSILLGCLLMPIAWFQIPNGANVGVLIKPLLLVATLLLAIRAARLCASSSCGSRL